MYFWICKPRIAEDSLWIGESASNVPPLTLGTEAKIEKVTDRAEFQKYNLLATPGLVINEKLVSAGRIPSDTEVMTWVADALEAA